MPLSLTYDDPLAAVFLRVLQWERSVRPEGPPSVTELVGNQVQTARQELGLAKTVKGAPHAFLARLRHAKKPLLTTGSPPRPTETEWTSAKNWRVLCVPPHSAVRQLSDRPIYCQKESDNQLCKQFRVVLRNRAIPELNLYVGNGRPMGSFEGRRGLYFLRVPEGFYLGQTDEFHIRMIEHKKKQPHWWVFVSPESYEQTVTRDTLQAAEALLISYWNEVSTVTNNQRGGDKKPAFAFLQQAVLLVESASAVMVWLMREKTSLKKDLAGLTLTDWNIPFKKCRGWHWPKCYLKVPKG
jgi:hypothetical protein